MQEAMTVLPILAVWVGMALFVVGGGRRPRQTVAAAAPEAGAETNVGEIGASVGETAAGAVLGSNQ